MSSLLALIALTILAVLAAFQLTPAWRQALAIAVCVIVALLWLVWFGAISMPAHARMP